MRVIRKAAILKMLGGVFFVPLWKGAKFWTYAFWDSRHLNGIFAEMQIVRLRVLTWEIVRKGRLGSKELQFLGLVFSRDRKVSDQISVLGKGRCFLLLFGKLCDMCDKG
jgi:hypothetical protein